MDDDASIEEVGTVSSTSPLRVFTDVDPDNLCPAALDGSVTITTSSRVRVQLRNPRLPLVVGVL